MAAHNPVLMAKLPRSYLEEDIGYRLTTVAIVFLVLQTIAVALYYSSRYINKNLNGLECWLFMPVGYIFSMALCVCGILIVNLGGAGRHLEAVLIQDPTGGIVMTRSKIDKAVEFIDLAAITGSKLVILCLYMRIFNTDRRYQLATYFVGCIILLNWFAAFILSLSICKPFAYQWTRLIPGGIKPLEQRLRQCLIKGKCGDIIATYQFICVPNILTDLMMLVLPLPALYKLHVDIGTKIGLFVTFMTGSVGIVTSLLRLVTFIHASELFKDPTYRCIPTFTYMIAEAGTYLIAACMPTLRPLKRRIFGDHSLTKSFGSFITKRTKGSKSDNSFRFTSYKGGIQMDSMRKGKLQDTHVQTSSTPHLSNVGFLKLNDNNVSIYSTTASREEA